MSLHKLLEAVERLENLTPEEKRALHERAAERMRKFDEECAERIRKSIPSQELLNKVCNWGTLYG
jgi:hypothetical protein